MSEVNKNVLSASLASVKMYADTKLKGATLNGANVVDDNMVAVISGIEETVNKISAITDADKASVDKYPSIKAITEWVENNKSELNFQYAGLEKSNSRDRYVVFDVIAPYEYETNWDKSVLVRCYSGDDPHSVKAIDYSDAVRIKKSSFSTQQNKCRYSAIFMWQNSPMMYDLFQISIDSFKGGGKLIKLTNSNNTFVEPFLKYDSSKRLYYFGAKFKAYTDEDVEEFRKRFYPLETTISNWFDALGIYSCFLSETIEFGQVYRVCPFNGYIYTDLTTAMASIRNCDTVDLNIKDVQNTSGVSLVDWTTGIATISGIGGESKSLVIADNCKNVLSAIELSDSHVIGFSGGTEGQVIGKQGETYTWVTPEGGSGGDCLWAKGAAVNSLMPKTNISNSGNVQGYGSLVVGYGNNTTTSATLCIVGGTNNSVSGGTGLIVGYGNGVDGAFSIVGGRGNTVNTQAGVVFGNDNTTTVKAENSIIGGQTNTIGNLANSVVVGQDLAIVGENANTLIGTAAFGQYNTLKANYTMVNGQGCVANAQGSHAEGLRTSAMTKYSHSDGYYTIAEGVEGEFACGVYNESVGGARGTVFSVGIGSSTDRKNGLDVRANGDVHIQYQGEDSVLQDLLGGGGGGSTNAITSVTSYNASGVSNTGVCSTENYNAMLKIPYVTSEEGSDYLNVYNTTKGEWQKINVSVISVKV